MHSVNELEQINIPPQEVKRLMIQIHQISIKIPHLTNPKQVEIDNKLALLDPL